MALPQMKTATYLMEVPSTGREIEFRPYTVKEEKVLMLPIWIYHTQTLLNF